MKLHEYQAKAILRQAGLPVPKGEVVFKAEEVSGRWPSSGSNSGVAKAQAYTGGRGKAGGIKLFKTAEEALALTKQLLGMTLVTKQTGPDGVKIEAVLLEDASVIKRELYVAVTLDRAKANIVFILSPEGGMDIEDVAEKTPDRILKLYPAWGRNVDPALAAQGAKFLGLEGEQAKSFADILEKLYRLYQEKDCSLLEINPLVVNGTGGLSLLDCKFNIDDNAVYRQTETGGDPDAEKDPSEIEAGKIRPQLHQAGRGYRLHGERRGPGHGHHGHHRPLRRAAGQLPGRGRLRLGRGRHQGLRDHQLGQERESHPGEHLRRHHALRRIARGVVTRSRPRASRCPWWSAWKAPT